MNFLNQRVKYCCYCINLKLSAIILGVVNICFNIYELNTAIKYGIIDFHFLQVDAVELKPFVCASFFISILSNVLWLWGIFDEKVGRYMDGISLYSILLSEC
ncbi:uncharacterized protein LOC116348664 isoform X2 [Contarinia nasturtii]|uniref:uncharacterized protein LOC116348664 isoform X2 n=1 Tax=Contarinia nasturtii TaxID=265458 RepID=UPI0012D419CB|nr:uncharacterized protein LOC116348664 isoform X2 [Contarinia nasturtii]